MHFNAINLGCFCKGDVNGKEIFICTDNLLITLTTVLFTGHYFHEFHEKAIGL